MVAYTVGSGRAVAGALGANRPRIAYTPQGEAELVVDEQPVLRFPLGSPRDFEVAAGDAHLCYRSLPERSGPPTDATRW